MDEPRSTTPHEGTVAAVPARRGRHGAVTRCRRPIAGGALALALSAVIGLPATSYASPSVADPGRAVVSHPAATATARDAQAPTRPRNGSVLIERGSGSGTFTVDNTESTSDAVVTLSRSDRAVRAMYVHAGAKATSPDVPDGTFDVFTQQGRNWDPTARRFNAPTSSGEFDRKAEFNTEKTRRGTSYTTITITLHAVVNGNVRVLPVPETAIPG